MSRHRQLMMVLATLKEEDNYIHFEDDAVLQVLLANGVGDGIGVTYDDAAKVTTISTWFQNNADITAFEEFAKFSGITNLVKYATDNYRGFYVPRLSLIGSNHYPSFSYKDRESCIQGLLRPDGYNFPYFAYFDRSFCIL